MIHYFISEALGVCGAAVSGYGVFGLAGLLFIVSGVTVIVTRCGVPRNP